MKIKFIAVFFLLFSIISRAQSINNNNNNNMSYYAYRDNIDNFLYKGAGIWISKKNNNKVQGNPYLYEKWNNTLIVYAKDGNKYKMNNSNYNALNDSFAISISSDSIYSFSKKDIDYVKLNNTYFKNISDDNINRFYAVLFDGENTGLVKSITSEIQRGSVNPMTNAKVKKDKYVLKESYYIFKDASLHPIKLNKKILKVLSDNDTDLKSFMKDKKLSYKNEGDIIKLIEYYDSIKLNK